MQLMPFKSNLNPSKWGRSVDRDIFGLQREINETLDTFLSRAGFSSPQVYDMSFYPAVDLQDREDRYLLEAELPGMKEDEVQLELHNNVLSIRGVKESEAKKKNDDYTYTERYFGSFRRDIPFEDPVDADNVKAELKNGILHIELLKLEKKKKSHKKIKITN